MDSLTLIGKYIVIPFILLKGCKVLQARYSLSKKSLHGKVVLITGASSGLGEALAEVFSDAGCRLVLAARRIPELERVRDKLTKDGCDPPRVIQMDLSNLQDTSEKAKEAIKFYGHIDILINNAGMSYRGKVNETKVDVDMQLMLVNYFGQVALTKAILPSMVENRNGTIVAISSIQGKLAIPFRSAYAASKHAFQAFFDTLRSEVSTDGINVCVVSPGYINTNLSLNAVTGSGSSYGKMDSATESGMSSKAVASQVYNAVITGEKDLVIAPIHHKLMILIRACFPWLYFLIMRYRAKKGN
ncbi:Dehydrogenase/reductase SDR family protein 7-like [Halotydeus destructor]|nr:Dehydrogenase/reductase SDR family protein 7-like [Halotydeus destructor]